MEDPAPSDGSKRKKRRPKPSASKSADVIPPTALEAPAAAAPAAAASSGPVRYEGCGPCKRAVADVPLSDGGRTSRDVLCLVFFVLWAIGDLIICIVGFKQGQPEALIYGLDYSGQVCGRNNKARAC